MDDWNLVERIRSTRDEAAFAELVRRHAGFVQRVIHRRLCIAAGMLRHVDDVVQAVFVLLWRRAPSQRHGAALSGWLYQTAIYACNNAMRTERIRQRHEEHAAKEAARRASVSPSVSESEKSVLTPEIELHLDAAMSALPRKDRDVLLMRYYENREVTEVGAVLGISQNTAAKRLSRAVARLRQILTDRGVREDSSLILAAAFKSAGSSPQLEAKIVESVIGTAGVAETSFFIEQIAEGVLQMIRQSQLKLAGMIALAFSVVLGAGLITMSVLHANEPPKEQPKEEAKAQAAAAQVKPSPATPKDTLKTFAKAIRSGDVDTMRALVKIDEPIEGELLDAACDYAKASHALFAVMKEKFGAEAVAKFAAQMQEATPLDVFAAIIEQTMDQAEETRDGDMVTLTPKGQPENALYVIRDGDKWLISASKNIEKWTDDMRTFRRDMMRGATDGIEQVTEEVKSGKLATIQDVGQALQQMMTGRGR